MEDWHVKNLNLEVQKMLQEHQGMDVLLFLEHLILLLLVVLGENKIYLELTIDVLLFQIVILVILDRLAINMI
jgi:hypothetical protein